MTGKDVCFCFVVFQEAGKVDLAPHSSVWDQFHRVCVHPGAGQDRAAAGFRSHSRVLPGMTSAFFSGVDCGADAR